jgi:hypothetical protein
MSLSCHYLKGNAYDKGIDEASLKKWKSTFAKDGIKYETDVEYREAIHNLVGFF